MKRTPLTDGGQDRNRAVDGYRGIWFRLGQYDGQYGDKYSGGLGTYTTKHVPMGVYAPGADRTFFTYGGTRREERDLLVMVGYYDHDSHRVSRPTVVDTKPDSDPGYESETVVDPHDNAAISLDGDGHVWVFVAGRGRHRPGRVYRSTEPYSLSRFERVTERRLFAYPQPWWVGDRFVVGFTIYDEDGHRELFWETSTDGRRSNSTKLAGFGGHYQVSEEEDGTVYSAFNWHPGGDLDHRTNLYVVRTEDGETWTTINGSTIDPPIEEPESDAIAIDYRARDRLVYLNDVAVDGDGNPVVLYVTSEGPEPGPDNDPRYWTVSRWDGREWRTETVTTADHNYDSGSLYVRDDDWFVVGPTDPGPQPYHTGGEVAVWRSDDRGATWSRVGDVTTDSEYNHTYVRRPHDDASPFNAFWADGDPANPSRSRLYFGDLEGRCWRLPESIVGGEAEPIGPL